MKRITIILSLFVASGIAALAQDEDKILGEWYTVEQKSVITFSKNQTNDEYTGKVSWVEDEDKQNLVGMETVKGLKFSAKEKSYSGQIYIPRFDTYKDCEIIIKDKKLNLTVKAGFKSKTVQWERKEK